jgi:hypothetical protein
MRGVSSAMNRFVWVVVACSPACQQGSPPPAATGSQGSAVRAHAADAARAIDAAIPLDAAPPDAGDPTEPLFGLTPMATRDGKLVLVKVVDDDGARGQPNLTLELRDRNDHALDRVVVLALDEEPDDATRAKRAAAANKLIASHDFVPLFELVADEHVANQFSGSGMTIHWDHEHFTFELDGKRVLDRAVPKKWRGGSYFDKGADLTCDNPDFLRGVYVAPATRLAVVDVAYRGNDTCWEPTGSVHVVTW